MARGGFYQGEKKKKKKDAPPKQGGIQQPFVLPQVEITGKTKRKDW